MYGTHDDWSDEDIRGIYLPGSDKVVRIKGTNETVVLPLDKDEVYHPLDKFLRLAGKGNPNIIEWLFAPEENVLYRSNEMEHLISNVGWFISRQIVPRFLGFAKSEEYDIIVDKMCKKTGIRDNEDIERYGYAGKSASNTIRLLEEIIEIIKEGTITFPRRNAEYLHRVKVCDECLDNVQLRIQELKHELDKCDLSKLPESADWENIENFYKGTVMKILNNKDCF